MTQRLNAHHQTAFAQSSLIVGEYDRSAPARIVHLGTGAFHRAHQAAYFDRLMRETGENWMIQGASLRSASVAEQMNPQDGLYTLVIRDNDAVLHQLIGSVKNVIVAPQDPEALIAALAAPAVCLVTLTITEKGYKPSHGTGGANDPDPDVRHDLAHPDTPRTALGFITAALARRKAEDRGGLTILSCDNLSENGRRVKEGVLAFAGARDPDLADWITAHCAFPSSMVDRIVPATTESDSAGLTENLGFDDRAMVKTEPFSQWVIEDWFVPERPALDTVGVQFTRDVLAWEKAKLRLLNGAHSALAYLGALGGHTYVHEAIAAPGYLAFVNALWDEAQATLDPIDGFATGAYRQALLSRFCNSSLQHRTVQIAMDGSQKLPQRLLNTIRDRIEAGLPSPALCLAVAAWMRWQMGVNEHGESFKVDDPLADQTAALICGQKANAASMVSALLTLKPVFGEDLPRHPGFSADLTYFLESLLNRGTAATVHHTFSELSRCE